MKGMTPDERFHELKLQGCSWERLSELERNDLGTVMRVNKMSLEVCIILIDLWRLRRLEAC
jgi:hypothetical protein